MKTPHLYSLSKTKQGRKRIRQNKLWWKQENKKCVEIRALWQHIGISLGLCHSHLFCALISENQGLEKLRSVSNLRKSSGPAQMNFFSVHLIFFFSVSPEFFSGLWYKSEKNPGDKLKKNSGELRKIQVCRNWNFSKV